MTAKQIWVPTRLILSLLVTLLMVFPLYWLVITSLKTPAELKAAFPTFWPETFAWSNYKVVFQSIPLARYGLNTIIQTVGIVSLQMNVALLAAYGFAKGNFWGRDKLFVAIIAALIVPEQVVFVPVYVMLSKLGWINTYWALIIPHGASAYSIFLLRQAFKSLSSDVMEAASMDGANRFRIIYRILAPMAMPTIITVLILKVISSWNSYFWPLIMTNTNNMRVLTVGISMFKESFPGMEMMSYHLIMAGSVCAIAPIVLLFVFAQKHIVVAMANSTFK
nr:carbohydrate ABC transporter permease [Paenibacillus sp. J31TS4]